MSDRRGPVECVDLRWGLSYSMSRGQGRTEVIVLLLLIAGQNFKDNLGHIRQHPRRRACTTSHNR